MGVWAAESDCMAVANSSNATKAGPPRRAGDRRARLRAGAGMIMGCAFVPVARRASSRLSRSVSRMAGRDANEAMGESSQHARAAAIARHWYRRTEGPTSEVPRDHPHWRGGLRPLAHIVIAGDGAGRVALARGEPPAATALHEHGSKPARFYATSAPGLPGCTAEPLALAAPFDWSAHRRRERSHEIASTGASVHAGPGVLE